jgi:hypothetical protein
MSFHYKFLAALGLTLLVVSLQGCASTPENTRAMLSEEVRGSFRQVGIVTKGPEPAPEVLGTLGPVGDVAIGAGKGLLIGTGAGILGGLLLGSLACGPAAGFCAAGALVLGTGVGLVGGTVTGGVIAATSTVPFGAASELETALTDALADRDLRSALRIGVLTTSTGATGAKLVDLGTAEETASFRAEDYESLAARGVDTTLEIKILQIALFQDEDEDSEFALLINIYTTLTAAGGRENVWSDDQVVYVSEPAEISLWTSPTSGHIQTEIQTGIETIAQEIGAQLFGME